MKAEIISIGDELLIGQTVNTNASWIGKELSEAGIDVVRVTTIADLTEEIEDAVKQSMIRADYVFITGGLGPTKDDITKLTLANLFNSELILDAELLKRIESFFMVRGREMIQSNIDQAKIPANCKVIDNDEGTACGMWFQEQGTHLFSMPGVPYEMKAMMSSSIIPLVKDQIGKIDKKTKTILIQGIGESFLAEKVTDWENEIRDNGFSLAYLPSPGIIRMRISYKSEKDDALVDSFFDRLKEMIPKNFIGDGNIGIEEHVANYLLKDEETIGTVESCTGGALAALLTKHSGASAFFKGSILTYDNEVKKSLVGVSQEILSTRGAVSEETVIQMAKAGREKLSIDWCIATSGIAGPTGGTVRKPVGFIWIAVAGPNGELVAKSFQFGDNRERNVKMAVNASLNLLRIVKFGL
jgi:nicotinamide-nucleotide amidase